MIGRDQRMTLLQAMRIYIERFGEGPPIFGMGEEEAMSGMIEAIASGKPMETGTETYISKAGFISEDYFSEDALI